MLWVLMGEKAYQYKEDQARGQGDLEHAYDSVFQWAVELTMLRMGLPADYVEYLAVLMREARTATITPFGLTDWIRRAAGLAQGGPHSCAQWNALIDVMAEMQRGLARADGVKLVDAHGKVMELLVQLYADDAHHCASGQMCVEGLEERFETAALWGAFFGLVNRVSKCGASVARFTEAADANDKVMMRQEEMNVAVLVRDEFTGAAAGVPMVDPYGDCRALGVQVSMAMYPDAAIAKATAEADVTARALRAVPRATGGLASMVARLVAWSRLRYRLMFVYAWPEMVERAGAKLRSAVLGASGLHSGAARAAVDTLVWMDLGQEMTIERLQMFLRVVRRGGVVGAALEGALQQLQRWEGTEQPVLEAPWRGCRCVEVLGARLQGL